jgi:hypothetical protein
MLYQLSYLADFHVKGVTLRGPFTATESVTLSLAPARGATNRGPERRHAATSHTCIDSTSMRSPAHPTSTRVFVAETKNRPAAAARSGI